MHNPLQLILFTGVRYLANIGDVKMKRMLSVMVAAMFSVALTACFAPQGDSPDQKRAAINKMHDETLAKLYSQRATASELVNKAAGYAVFSNVNAQWFFVGGAGGFGVAVDRSSGHKTYMQMAQLDLGFGFGVQDIRVVFIFHSARAYMDFVNSGWEFGGQADAAAKVEDKGVAATGEVSIDAETTMYTMSEAGLMAKVNLAGTKYWRDNSLNY
jgi:lipid-binding SYLF domain-containing protein